MIIRRILLLALALLAFSFPAATGLAAVDDLIARVGEVPISAFDLSVQVQRKIPSQVSFHGRIAPEKIAAITDQALAQLIDQAYWVNWAREQKISLSQDEVDQAMKPLLGQVSSLEALKEKVGEKPYNDIRALIYREVLARKAEEKALAAEVQVSDEAVKAYYEENKKRFFRPRQFRASHILIKVDPAADAEQKKALEEKAENLLAQARAGENFHDLAYFNSDDRSKFVGGDLGYFHEGQAVEEFEEAMLKLEPGEISDLVRTRYGYHIIRLVERNEPRQLSFEEMAPKIRAQLEEEQKAAAREKWMEKLRASYPLARYDGSAAGEAAN